MTRSGGGAFFMLRSTTSHVLATFASWPATASLEVVAKKVIIHVYYIAVTHRNSVPAEAVEWAVSAHWNASGNQPFGIVLPTNLAVRVVLAFNTSNV